MTDTAIIPVILPTDTPAEGGVINAPQAHAPLAARCHQTNPHAINRATLSDSTYWADDEKPPHHGRAWRRLTLNERYVHILTCPDMCWICGPYRQGEQHTVQCGGCERDVDMPKIGADGGMDELRCPVCGCVNWDRTED